MIRFFHWLSSLSTAEAVGYSLLVCGIMLAFPFSGTIKRAFMNVVFARQLKIEYFTYQFYPVGLIKEVQGEHMIEVLDSPDFVVEDSKAMLHWHVEGAISVLLLPHVGKVEGNMAEIIVNQNRRVFQLEVRGIFKKITATVEIPLEKIKVLNTAEISDTTIESKLINVGTYDFSKSLIVSYLRDLPTAILSQKKVYFRQSITEMPLAVAPGTFFCLPPENLELKKELEVRLNAGNMLKKYHFSTAKYNEVNHFNNPNL